MDTTMKTNNPIYQESLFRRWWKSRSFIQQRMIRMCMSMLVMVLCFPLYYLGLFGTVDGPLHPVRLGDTLAGMGMTRTHSITLFLCLLILAVTWNLIYNIACQALGARLTCKRTLDDEGTVCGAAVRRSRSVDRKTGQRAAQYECTHGHKRADAHFHPKKKRDREPCGVGDLPGVFRDRCFLLGNCGDRCRRGAGGRHRVIC
jgi:fumarate reductase subunit C